MKSKVDTTVPIYLYISISFYIYIGGNNYERKERSFCKNRRRPMD